MPGDPSFYYAIFKKLQASYHWVSGASFDGHLTTVDSSPSLYGGFSLKWPGDPYGIFGSLSAAAPNIPQPGFQLAAGLRPLNPASLVPGENPLYAMLAASLGPDGTIPNFVTVGGQKWPVMPPPEQVLPAPALGSQTNGTWLQFNAGSPPPLMAALGAWIKNGKADDSPKGPPLSYPALMAIEPKPFPGASTAILFVASFEGDDGRRNGDHAMPGVPLGHVPGNFWDTAQIFLTDKAGNIVTPSSLPMGAEYYVAAVLGNFGDSIAGLSGTPKVELLCDAFCFNTFLSPNVPLPSLSSLDPADTSPVYQQYFMDPLTYDVAGFRFTVDTVFAGLVAALQAANVNLGGLTPAHWLKDGHPCVKVRITSGEWPNMFKPQNNVPLTLASDPRKDRHIAQRNLAPFDMTLMAKKGVHWTNFIVAQAGGGSNGLAIKGGLRFYVAVPTLSFERYVTSHRGFELVREGVAKPFPDAVILRRTIPEARLEIADHAREPFLGMSLGIEEIRPMPQPGDVTVVHTRQDRHVAGGFTLRPHADRIIPLP